MLIYITAYAEAPQNSIICKDETHFDVFVAAPKKRGIANKKIVEMISNYYASKKQKVRVRFVSGAQSIKKIFEVTYIL